MVLGDSSVMSERDHIFARIREALRIEAHAHGDTGLPTMAEQRHVLPPTGATADEQFALFAKNAADLRATFKFLNDANEAAAELKAVCMAEKW